MTGVIFDMAPDAPVAVSMSKKSSVLQAINLPDHIQLAFDLS